MTDNFLTAATSLTALEKDRQRLERENAQLIEGTARQAKSIRQLNEQLSAKETEVQVEQYNVEFVKQQARKTRFKHRDEVKALKAQIEHLRKQVSEHEKRRVQAEQTTKDYYLAYAGIRPKPVPEVIFTTEGESLRGRLTMRLEDYLMRSQTAQFDILSMQMTYLDEHKGDLRIVEEIARSVAKQMTTKLEAKIVETLMGKPMTRDERARAECERRRKQDRQLFSDGWPVL